MHVFQGNSGKDETTGRLLIEDARNQIRKKRPRHNYKKMPREYRRKKGSCNTNECINDDKDHQSRISTARQIYPTGRRKENKTSDIGHDPPKEQGVRWGSINLSSIGR